MKVVISQSFICVPATAYYADDVVDVPQATAREWVEAGLARPLDKQPEFAVKPQHKSRTRKS